MGNDQEAPPGEREQWEASLHMIFNILLGNQDQMIIVNLVVRYCIALIRATRSNLTCGPMEEHNRNFSHAKARPSIRSMKTKIWGWSHGFKNKRLRVRVQSVQFSWWPHLPHLWTKACSASLINFKWESWTAVQLFRIFSMHHASNCFKFLAWASWLRHVMTITMPRDWAACARSHNMILRRWNCVAFSCISCIEFHQLHRVASARGSALFFLDSSWFSILVL